MKLQIKNLKHMDGHDCMAFNLTLYIDGKKSMTVRNDGNGGCHFYESTKMDEHFPQSDYDKLKEMADGLPKEVTDMKNDDGTFFEYQPDVDSIIDGLIYDSIDLKKLKGDLKKQTLIHDFEDGRDVINAFSIKWEDRAKQFKWKGEEGRKSLEQKITHKQTVLNALPIEEAFQLYKKGTGLI